MKSKSATFFKFSMIALMPAMLAALGVPAQSQDAPAVNVGDLKITGVPEDWSHHHVVFSNPGTEEEAIRNGTHDQWLKIVNNPRYIMQQLKRKSPAQGPAAVDVDRAEAATRGAIEPAETEQSRRGPFLITPPEGIIKLAKKLKKDWNMSVGNPPQASLTVTIATPLSTSNISSSSTLTVDGVTFDASAPTDETATITFSSTTAPVAGSTVTIGSTVYTFATGTLTAPMSGCNVSSATGSVGATDLFDAITLAVGSVYKCAAGVTANAAVTATHTGGSSTITLTAKIAGSTGFIFSRSATGTNFTTFTSATGSNGTTSGTTFAYWSGATFVSSPALAANIATALGTNATTSAAISAVSATGSGGTGTVTFTALTGGTPGNSLTASVSSFTAASGAGTFNGGVDSTVQLNTYPAKYSFATSTSSCSDFVVYPTGIGGTQATIVGYNNLYLTTCSSAPPTIAFAYNTDGTAGLSPTLSLDGTQIAYVETVGSAATLVIMKPSLTSGGTISSPATITSEVTSSYRGCAAPCYTTITFSGSANDTNSSPFYDFFNDVLYVGDNNGVLHKFTGVFTGSPAEITGGGATSGWPQTMASGVILTGPILDWASGNVFVGSSGGVLYRIPGGGTAIGGGSSNKVASAVLSASGSTGIVDAPLIDEVPATPLIYVFVGDSTAGTALVEQFPTSFASAAAATHTATVSSVSGSASTTQLYIGAFDNLHYDIGATGGNMYVCGVHSSGAQSELYQIPMTGTFGASSNEEDAITADDSVCSPVTEFLGAKANTTLNSAITTTSATSIVVASGTGIARGDYLQVDTEIMLVGNTYTVGSTTVPVTRGALTTVAATHNNLEPVQDIQDWLYLSVTANGGDTGCTGACLYNYLTTTGTSPTNSTSGIAATGGASGVIVDNSLTATGESEIYYVSQLPSTCTGNGTTGSGTGTCAVQTSQSAP